MAKVESAFQLHRGETEAWGGAGQLAQWRGEKRTMGGYASEHLIHRTDIPLLAYDVDRELLAVQERLGIRKLVEGVVKR